jgi:hypothetical protein
LYHQVPYGLHLRECKQTTGYYSCGVNRMKVKLANFSVSFETALNAALLVISTLHIPTSTFLSVALTAFRMVFQA